MSDFSATDAAFEGFRVTREQRKAVLVWWGLAFAASLLMGLLLISIAGEAYGDLTALQRGGGRPDPDELLAALGRVAPAFLLLLPIALLWNAVFYSAIYRAMLRPEEGGPGFLKLGGDEFRVLGTLVLLFLLLLGVCLLGGMIIGALGATVGAGLATVGVLLLLVGIIFLAVRMSLAVPATFAERRIRIFESWRLTKGRFWPLFGAYVLAIVMSILVRLLATMIYFALASLLAGGIREASAAFSPDMSSIADWLTPAMFIYLLIESLLIAITTVLLLAPSAVAYREFGGAATPAASTD